MNNEDFQKLQSGDIVQDERTKEHLMIVQEGHGNHLYAVKLISIFDPRFYAAPSANGFAAILPPHDTRPFTAPEDAPVVPAPTGHGNLDGPIRTSGEPQSSTPVTETKPSE